MRTLQLLTLALLATAANADYYMSLCGGKYGPCTVQPTMTAATDEETQALVNALGAS
jgi:hypothetical protein